MALDQALRLVSKQIRENPSKEHPGGATPALLAMLQGQLFCMVTDLSW